MNQNPGGKTSTGSGKKNAQIVCHTPETEVGIEWIATSHSSGRGPANSKEEGQLAGARLAHRSGAGWPPAAAPAR